MSGPASATKGSMRVCVYEDRASDVVAVKVLVASLQRHAPDLEIEATLPSVSATDARWFARRPNLHLRTDAATQRGGYDVKPTILTRAMDEGAASAVWIDSDIVVTGDPRSLIDAAPADALVVTEEMYGFPNMGGTRRTVGLGLPVGRVMPNTANSSVLRVTPRHRALLERWESILRGPAYVDAQSRPFAERPVWFGGDQEVLTGLLGSSEFADVPIAWVRRGREIAHCFQIGGLGYNILERSRNVVVQRTPLFIHSIGSRPWRPPDGRRTLHLETSPYTIAAAPYEGEVEEPLPWTRPTLRSARVLRSVFRDHVTLAGLIPALGRELRDLRILKTKLRSVLRPA